MRIGDDILQVDSFGQYELDGVEGADLEDSKAKLAGFPIYFSQPDEKQKTFDIVLDDEKTANITLHVFKDLVAVKLREGEDTDFYWNSSGLLGSFEGKMLARDGKTIMTDPNEFGQEWQVRDTDPKLFQTARPPQYPEKCLLPFGEKVVVTQRRRLGAPEVQQEEAERACEHLDREAKKNCILDGKQSSVNECLKLIRSSQGFFQSWRLPILIMRALGNSLHGPFVGPFRRKPTVVPRY